MNNNNEGYFYASKNILYSLLLIFPMLFLYEILGFIQNYGSHYYIRNGADAIIRHLFSLFGENAHLYYGLSLFILFVVVFIKNFRFIKNNTIKIHFLAMMIFESLICSLALLICIRGFASILLSLPYSDNLLEQFYLSIGAGVWEELLFRFGLLSLLILFFKKILNYSIFFSQFMSIFISGVIFSLFHYIGIFGDVFTWYSFSLRSIAGFFLGSIFLFRGLGISVYTHIFYDMILVSIPTFSL
jgi:hypothetical protein